MELGSVLPGPNRLLLVLPDERLVEKALRSQLAVWVVTDPREHSAAWLRGLRDLAELVLVDGRDSPQVTDVAEETARRNGIAHVLPAGYASNGRAAARLLSDAAAIRRLLAQPGRPVVSQDQPAGRELLVSTLTVDGMHHLVGITERTRKGANVAGVDYVHPAILARRDKAAVAAAVTSLLDLAGHEFGPAETEVALAVDGPLVVASGAWFSRHRVPELIELASGFDVEYGLLRAIGGQPLVPPPPVRAAGLGWLATGPVPAPLADRIVELPGVARLDRPEPGSDPAVVLVHGDSAEQVTARLAAVRSIVADHR